jgi:DNA-binding ferritin-like protein
MAPMATEAAHESTAASGLRRIVADAVLLRLHCETTIWNLDATSAGAAMVLERASTQLYELMRDAAIRVHVLQGSTNWSLDEIRAQSRVSSREIALSGLARELERLCEECRIVMRLASQRDDSATERLLASRIVPLEQASWGLNQFCRQASSAR